MADSARQYLCLDDNCKGKKAMTWTNFYRHQRRVHHSKWTLHLQTSLSFVEFQVWFKYVQENYLRLPVVKKVGDCLYGTCDLGSSTTCTARLCARPLETGVVVTLYMGEHYGHQHCPGREERLFLLDYVSLALSPVEQWLKHFSHAGLILEADSTPFLKIFKQQLTGQSIPFVVLGFMNQHQLQFLDKYQWTICLESHGEWIVMYSVVARADDPTKTPITFPVAYCYSNYLVPLVLIEFFRAIRERTGILDCFLVVSNNYYLFEEAWDKVFPENDSIFVPSWDDMIQEIIKLPNPVEYSEINEIEDILRKAACKNQPSSVKAGTDFFEGVKQSPKLSAETINDFSKSGQQHRIQRLLSAWMEDTHASGWSDSLCHSFSAESYYINKATLSPNLPKSIMHLTLHFRHVLKHFPSIDNLIDFDCLLNH